jgi:hypothetical protein
VSRIRARALARSAAVIVGCGWFAFGLGGVPTTARASDSAAADIKSDTHHLAVDVRRESHVVGHRVERQTHELRRRRQTTRDHVSLQLHHAGQRLQRWWNRVKAG